ncbi:putative galanin receptor type 2-like [Apostichopus japonicus]|uniref:Putative galanin receptor type 2-like n=1 Tax=Stichopus japonicus TaxID=307972 RepID=A0A2G8L061_STIJA|nr:putative galanin receptor type 2-like [Apostichopus japonicus]
MTTHLRTLHGLITINIVIGTCGFLGNSVVVIVFLARGKKTFKNWTQMYILHQSSIDCLASMVFLLLRYFNDSATLAAGGRRQILICKIWFSEYFLWSLFMVSTYNLVLVSLERFLAIVFPVLHRNHMSRRKVLATMVVPWLWAFTFQSYWPPVYELFGTDCFPVWPQRWLQPFFGVLTFLFEYFLPLMVMLISYGTIIYKLKGMSDKRENQASRMQADTRNSNLTADPTSYPAISTISNMPTQENPRTNGTLKPAKKEANIYSKPSKTSLRLL